MEGDSLRNRNSKPSIHSSTHSSTSSPSQSRSSSFSIFPSRPAPPPPINPSILLAAITNPQDHGDNQISQQSSLSSATSSMIQNNGLDPVISHKHNGSLLVDGDS